MHFNWMVLILFALLLIAAHLVITAFRKLLIKRRMAWLLQEITAAGSSIRHTAHVSCECCHARKRRMIIYSYGGDEYAPRITHVCHRCHQRLHPMIQQRLQGADAQAEEVAAR